MLLDHINKPNDIKNIKPGEYGKLAAEIREFMVEKVSHTGGHLASSLGTVELTMALHLAFDLPKDKIIWDVGHQSYTHKILTGRKDGFDSLRQLGGMSGFPNRDESECDVFTSGHSSTSISTALGLCEARDLSGADYRVVAVIGDGALTGGMAYEALNNAGRLRSNLIIVLNDNNMSISENIGFVSRMTSGIRTAPGYIGLKEGVGSVLEKLPGGDALMQRLRSTKSSFKQLFIPRMMFEDMGLTYLGPVDGSDIKDMLRVINDAKRMNSAVVIHVMTKKGKGYEPAEKNPEHFHGVGRFDVDTGMSLGSKGPDYSRVAGAMLCRMAENDPSIVCITAAMTDGVGLKNFSGRFRDRFFDVGIAEQHAVTFAAGLAEGGMKPYVCIYSSFLQRAYDQIIHDVCIQRLPVTFLIDRAGIVGSDGITHQGLFDIAYLGTIPGITVIAPKNGAELASAIRFSEHFDGPLAIRYPRGGIYRGLEDHKAPLRYGKAEIISEKEGDTADSAAIIAAGAMVREAADACERLTAEGYRVTLVNARFLKPFDEELFRKLCNEHEFVFTAEEGAVEGGFGQRVAAWAKEQELPAQIRILALPDAYLEHGDQALLRRKAGLDADGIYGAVSEALTDREG
ncbi:MAG: 1-deoxy-D-xylulose-5-phosphate synthase [Lachnospiraceae bacterium]|nr:1-deoxy-D-xylulose-5-phosphate synthase [Lachnospiraceae bacterium]